MASKPDTLLIVTTSYAWNGDGSEAAGAFVADLAQEIGESMPVRILGPGKVESRKWHGNVEVWSFKAPDRPLSSLSPMDPRDWLPIIRTLHSMRRMALAANSDLRVRYTLALWVLPSGWIARTLQKKHGVPYGVWALGSDIWSLGKYAIPRRFLAAVSNAATHAYADGIQLAKDASKITARDFDFLPSTRSIDGKREAPVALTPPFKFLFLGRWHPNKGIDLLLDALEKLCEADWARIKEIHIAGGGALEPLVRQRVAELLASGRPIRTSGYLGKQEAAKALGEADRLLLPSRIDSIPVVFSDAMKFSLPVVSMPVGDLVELVGSGTGWLAERVDAASFAAAIRVSLATVHDPALISAMSDRFSLSTIAERIMANDLGVTPTPPIVENFNESHGENS